MNIPKQTKYRIGDTFSVPLPGVYKFRIRESIWLDHWDGPQYAMQLYTKRPGVEIFGWLNLDNDRHFTDGQIEEYELSLIKRGPVAAPVQMELF